MLKASLNLNSFIQFQAVYVLSHFTPDASKLGSVERTGPSSAE